MSRVLSPVSRSSLWVVLFALALTGCVRPGGESAAPTSGGGFSLDPQGEAAPDFTLSDVDGAPVRLADSAGQIRLIDFWATWCAPCREEIPMLRGLHDKYADRGLAIVAITDERGGVIRDFAAKHAMPYVNLVEGEDVAMEYGVLGLPTAFLIDGEGKIVERFMGPKPASQLEQRIVELLEARAET